MGAVHDVPVEGSEAGVGSGVWHSVTFVMVERSWDPCSWFMVHGSWFWNAVDAIVQATGLTAVIYSSSTCIYPCPCRARAHHPRSSFATRR